MGDASRDGEPANSEKQAALGGEFFLKYDQDRMVERFGLESDDRFIYVGYIDDSFRIDRETSLLDVCCGDGRWESYGDPYTALVIYDMLCHFQDQEGDPAFSGEFCLSSGLTSMVLDPAPFKGLSQLDVLAGHADDLAEACERMGGKPREGATHADFAYTIPVFDWFDTIFEFWDGDDEFEPQANFFWDRNTLLFMHYETLAYVRRDILKKAWPGIKVYPEYR